MKSLESDLEPDSKKLCEHGAGYITERNNSANKSKLHTTKILVRTLVLSMLIYVYIYIYVYI